MCSDVTTTPPCDLSLSNLVRPTSFGPVCHPWFQAAKRELHSRTPKTGGFVVAEFAKLLHVSYSALSDWLRCGKYFQLKRLIGLPERPAVWNKGGHGVHNATEAHDRMIYEIVGG